MDYASKLATCIAATICALFLGTRAADGAVYHVTELGFEVLPKGLNDHGHVVGTLRRDPDSSTVDHPFYWKPTTPNDIQGTLSELPMLSSGNGDGTAESINNMGQIVGSSSSSSDDRAVLWSPTSGGLSSHSLHILNPAQPTPDHIATSINEAGQIIGSRYNANGAPSSSFIWTPNVPNGTSGSRQSISLRGANSLNDQGLVAGRTYEFGTFPDTINHGVIWSSATNTLADLGEPPGTWSDVFALSINNVGQIVGYAAATDGGRSGFLWTPSNPNSTSGVMQLLPGMDYAFDINDEGTVVGSSQGGMERAMLWTEEDGAVFIQDLIDPALNIDLRRAIRINNEGQIIGLGRGSNGRSLGLLLTPIPEPAAAALALLGLLLISNCGVGREKRQLPARTNAINPV